MSLAELHYVAVLARELSFTRAAAAIPMAQPALSQAISRIERRLGVVLFLRTSRKVEPTPAGAVLAERAEAILGDVRTALSDTRLAGESRRLRVHVTEQSLQVARAATAAIRGTVAVPVEQLTAPWESVGPALLAGDLDLAIGPRVIGPGISSVRLRSETVGAVVSADHPLADAGAVSFAELAGFPVVSIDRGLSSWDRTVQRWFELEGLEPQWTRSTAFGAVAGTDLVADGRAVLFALESVAYEQARGRRFLLLDPPRQADWFLSHRGDADQLPVVAAAVRAAIDGVATLPPALTGIL